MLAYNLVLLAGFALTGWAFWLLVLRWTGSAPAAYVSGCLAAFNARYLADHLRPGLRPHDARDVLWLYSSPELFDLLVRRRHWSVRRYSEFIAAAMIDALL